MAIICSCCSSQRSVTCAGVFFVHPGNFAKGAILFVGLCGVDMAETGR